MAVDNFEELKRISENCVQGMKLKGCFNSTRRLLEKLYPDKAHFIYELIQNAEDAGATKVEFYLKDSELLLIHNGTKLFDLSHIESITNIGDSTKKRTRRKYRKIWNWLQVGLCLYGQSGDSVW